MRLAERKHNHLASSLSDIDAIYARAKRAGAKMVMDLEENEHGGKAFTCTDPEGHVWHVGTFDPWEPQQA